MPKKLTVAEQVVVAKASQDLYRYERICEEHSAVLRRDVEACLKAHQEYTANSPPMGFMPPSNEFDRYIEESEKVLEKKCRTVLEYRLMEVNGGFMHWSSLRFGTVTRPFETFKRHKAILSNES